MQSKSEVLKKLKLSTYRIYGIFDFKTKTLVYIHLDSEQVELEFDLEGYDEERYDVVSFDLALV